MSISKVEHLSGVWAAVIRDVKMLRQKFRQEVDRVYDQLKEIEKNQTCEKEASNNREKGDSYFWRCWATSCSTTWSCRSYLARFSRQLGRLTTACPSTWSWHYVIFWQIACMNSPHNSKG